MSKTNGFKFLEVAVILEIEKNLQQNYILAKNVVYTNRENFNNISEMYEEVEKIGLSTPFGARWIFSGTYKKLEDLILKENFEKYINLNILQEQEINNIKQNYKELMPFGEIKNIFCTTYKNQPKNNQTPKTK